MHDFSNTRIPSLSDSELGVTLLRSRHPRRYAAWVLAGITMALFGYGLTTLWLTLTDGPESLPFQRDTWVLVLCLLALRLWSVGRIRAAGTLILLTVLFEAHATFALAGVKGWPTASLILPLLNFVSGLWMGKRFAGVMSAVTIVTVPFSIYLSGVLNTSQGLNQPGVPVFVITLVAMTFTTQWLLTSFLRALGEVLRRSEMEEWRARELIDGTPDAIVVLSPEGVVEDINDATERILGLEKKTIIGRRLDELPLSGPGGRNLSEILENPELDGPVELMAGMGRIPLETLVRPLSSLNGGRGKLLVLRDISKRREAESQNHDLLAQLQQAQKMEAVGLLAGGIAHDFNNLLTAVGGYGSLLALSADPESREFGMEIKSVQKRGSALIRQLLTFARRDTSEPRAIDLGDLLNGCAPLVQRLLGERIPLRLVNDEHCPILADPGRIEQVILNLAANTRDATTGDGSLHIHVFNRDDRVILKVEDDGKGIPEAIRSRIFEPFFTTKDASKGSGLGLAAVHGIVTAAGGTIAVNSSPSGGACFELSFPRTRRPIQTESPQPVRPRRRAKTGTRIMLAEDNDGVRTYLKRLLEHAGYQVEVQRSGKEAWLSLQKKSSPPDLLLSDVIMPGLTGPELVQRAHSRWPNLRFLFISGYLGDEAQSSDWEDLIPEQQLLMKPFSDEVLLDRLEHILNLNVVTGGGDTKAGEGKCS